MKYEKIEEKETHCEHCGELLDHCPGYKCWI